MIYHCPSLWWTNHYDNRDLNVAHIALKTENCNYSPFHHEIWQIERQNPCLGVDVELRAGPQLKSSKEISLNLRGHGYFVVSLCSAWLSHSYEHAHLEYCADALLVIAWVVSIFQTLDNLLIRFYVASRTILLYDSILTRNFMCRNVTCDMEQRCHVTAIKIVMRSIELFIHQYAIVLWHL